MGWMDCNTQVEAQLLIMAHKLFNVVEDMQGMTSDQLKGAIRNMEEVGNMLHTLFRALVNEDTEKMTVMGLDWDQLAPWLDEMHLPGVTGVTEIVSKERSTSLLSWQLRFFHEFGNLNLEVDKVVSPTTLKVSASNMNTETHAGWIKYVQMVHERQIRDGAIYESMRNLTKTK